MLFIYLIFKGNLNYNLISYDLVNSLSICLNIIKRITNHQTYPQFEYGERTQKFNNGLFK